MSRQVKIFFHGFYDESRFSIWRHARDEGQKKNLEKKKLQFSPLLLIPETEACPVSQFRISSSKSQKKRREACFPDSDISSSSLWAAERKNGAPLMKREPSNKQEMARSSPNGCNWKVIDALPPVFLSLNQRKKVDWVHWPLVRELYPFRASLVSAFILSVKKFLLLRTPSFAANFYSCLYSYIATHDRPFLPFGFCRPRSSQGFDQGQRETWKQKANAKSCELRKRLQLPKCIWETTLYRIFKPVVYFRCLGCCKKLLWRATPSLPG